MFHCLNAYDNEQGQVVVDLCQYEQSFDVSTLWAAHGPVTLDRWIIDPAVGTITQQRLDDRGQEFPRVDDRIISRPHRYGYSAVIGEVTRAITAAGDFGDDAFTNAILRHDLARGTVEAHEFGRDATAGEAVFAPSSPDAGEDDGYVMAFVHNPDRGAADLVLLAAQDFTAEPVARVHLPGSRWAFTAAGSPATNWTWPLEPAVRHTRAAARSAPDRAGCRRRAARITVAARPQAIGVAAEASRVCWAPSQAVRGPPSAVPSGVASTVSAPRAARTWESSSRRALPLEQGG